MVAGGSPVGPKLSVTVRKIETVQPENPREDHVYTLSNLDQRICMLMKTVSLYLGKEEAKADPAKVIKESLVKLLDYYYPLAGRLGVNEAGKLQVNYNSQGVLFVEASTESNIADFGNISMPDERLEELVYISPEAAVNVVEAPLVTAQVTKFKCGGFALGLANQHAMFDGIGATQMMTAWSEIARGLPISTPPFLDRSILQIPAPAKFGILQESDSRIVIEELVHDSFCFTPADMDVLKMKLMTEGGPKRCTTFEVLSALIWKARTMALKMDPEKENRLYIVVDGRPKFSPPLPANYMGNAVINTCAVATASALCGNPLYYAVKLIQNAVAAVDDSYVRSTTNFFSPLSRGAVSIIISTWTHLKFQTNDFGWGEPYRAGPVRLPVKQCILFLSSGKDSKNIDVVLVLPPKFMGEFQKILKEVIDTS